MTKEFTDVKFTDVTILGILHEGEVSAVFKVIVHKTTCVMKLWHDWLPRDCESPFVRETTAYRQLKANGLCERGVIPDFYGTITDIKLSILPSQWPQDTYSIQCMFQEDNSPLDALLLEYIPGLEMIDLSNYSAQYLDDIRQT
ncbi:hypothetical protein N7517_011486 [Penicillium concentricum]|uniref:Protein kinase domain-containing protein n=1 Tax=Penicillium concentricum TaxID=293559 RepID=A0A9W9UTK3_9EURO|nr:uncharacterized protein N7517_011486 [Penicillium concentricum]KAJ5356877.1 hypothetical protein N7517_011486 [Penicillium concentricum]